MKVLQHSQMASIGVSMTLGFYERAKFLSIRVFIVFFISAGGTQLVYSIKGHKGR